MAYGAQVSEPTPLICTIQVWPTPDLIVASWTWPTPRHDAYQQVAGALGLAAALCILDGDAIGPQDFEIPSPLGSVTFRVLQTDTSIHITITAFNGPDAPGPNGGARQPGAIEGLVLGLRGSGKCFRLVVFHGYMPPMPAFNILPLRNTRDIYQDTLNSSVSAKASKTFSAAKRWECLLQLFLRDPFSSSADHARTGVRDHALEPECCCGRPIFPTLPRLLPSYDLKIRHTEALRLERTENDSCELGSRSMEGVSSAPPVDHLQI